MAECEAVTRNGRVCGAHALRGAQFCFMHSPERAGQRAAARRLGGLRRGSHAGDISSLPLKVQTVSDVLEILNYCLAECLVLDNGIPRSRVLIALASEYLKALEVGEFEERLTALEERAKGKP